MKFFDLFKKKKHDEMNTQMWNTISSQDDVQSILEKSKKRPQLIYKHSNSCSVSYLAKNSLDKNIETYAQYADLYIVHVIQQRELSNKIASELNTRHESPQSILVKDGNVVWKGSHWNARSQAILDHLTEH